VNVPTPLVGQDHQDEQEAARTIGTTKKSAAMTCSTWFAKNVRHVCDGGCRRRTMYFATAD
jgi:adenylyl- and sulfurtransferase ThiI